MAIVDSAISRIEKWAFNTFTAGLPGDYTAPIKAPQILEVVDKPPTLGKDAVKISTYVRKPGELPKSPDTGKVLQMTPYVPGGLQEGDIVLSTQDPRALTFSGMLTSLKDRKITQAQVSHSGIVVRDPQTKQLMVVHMGRDPIPPDLYARMTPDQQKKACFLTEVPIDRFFNDGIDRGVVMRPKDQAAARTAAQNALDYLHSQVTPDAIHPWYYNQFPELHRDGPGGKYERGGLCATFVDLCYGNAFGDAIAGKIPLPFFVSPEQFFESPQLQEVGDKQITAISQES